MSMFGYTYTGTTPDRIDEERWYQLPPTDTRRKCVACGCKQDQLYRCDATGERLCEECLIGTIFEFDTEIRITKKYLQEHEI